MNDDSPDRKAWIWYDVANHDIQHIGFNPDADYGVGLVKLAVSFQLALDISTGKQKLVDYKVVTTGHEMVLQRKKDSLSKPKFWHLMDPEALQRTQAFGYGEDETSPVLIRDKDHQSFKVDVLKLVKNIQFYITMKNDPNYLIKTIDLYPNAFASGSATDIRIDVDLGHDYSIYVRYDAS